MNPSDCLFCAIAAGKVPAHIVLETDELLAFLDINPIRPGHTQVIPKRHFAFFDDLPPETLQAVSLAGQRIARALKEIHPVQRVGFAFTGGDVAHAHAHVVPLVEAGDLTSRRYIAEEVVTFTNPPRPPRKEFVAMAERIRARLEASGD